MSNVAHVKIRKLRSSSLFLSKTLWLYSLNNFPPQKLKTIAAHPSSFRRGGALNQAARLASKHSSSSRRPLVRPAQLPPARRPLELLWPRLGCDPA